MACKNINEISIADVGHYLGLLDCRNCKAQQISMIVSKKRKKINNEKKRPVRKPFH